MYTELVWLFMTLFPLLTKEHLFSNAIDVLAALSPSLLLSLLFLGSTTFTEQISSSKYPAYAAYQRRVGMFWPVDTLRKWVWLRVVRGKAGVEEVDKTIWNTSAKQTPKRKNR